MNAVRILFLALMLMFIGFDACNAVSCRLLTTAQENAMVYSRAEVVEWLYTNFTMHSAPLTNECAVIADVVSAMRRYEDHACLMRNMKAVDYLSQCGVSGGPNMCYNTIPASSYCGCLGSSDDYRCAMVAIINKMSNRPLRT